MSIKRLLLTLACILFVLAAIGFNSARINLTDAGLALWVLTSIL